MNRGSEISARCWIVGWAVLAFWGCGGPASWKSGGTIDATKPPVLVSPKEVRLGERELGEQLQAVAELENHGGQVLELGSFRKTCSCGPIEVEENGVYRPAIAAEVPPGSKRRVRMAMAVAGEVGQQSRQRLEFVTNDPQQPVAAVEFVVDRILAAPSAIPPSIALGRVLLGTKTVQIVEIRDPATIEREIVSIEFTPSGRVSVFREDPTIAEREHRTAAGRLVTRLRLVVDTSVPGTVDATIRVNVAGQGRRGLQIGITGFVEPPITSIPRDVVLPKRGSSGKVYATAVRLQPFTGRIERVEVRSLPAGVAVELPVISAILSNSLSLWTLMSFPRRLRKRSGLYVFRSRSTVPSMKFRFQCYTFPEV